jgi:hypothetical protein
MAKMKRQVKKKIQGCAWTMVFWAVALGAWWIWLNRVPTETVASVQSPAAVQNSVANAAYTALRNLTVGEGAVTGDLTQETAWHKKSQATLTALHEGVKTAISAPDSIEKDITYWQDAAKLLCREADYFAARQENKAATDSALDAIALGVKLSNGLKLENRAQATMVEKIGREKLDQLVPRLLAEEAREVTKRLEAIESERSPVRAVLVDQRKENEGRLLRLFSEKNVFQLPLHLREKSTPDWQVYLAEARMAITPKRRIWGNYLHYMNGKTQTPPTDPISPFFLPEHNKAKGEKAASAQAKAQEADATNEAAFRLLCLRCALRAYQLETGETPEQLGRLMEEEIISLPLLDPFGEPNRSLQLAPDTGKAFSVGLDGKASTADDILGS